MPHSHLSFPSHLAVLYLHWSVPISIHPSHYPVHWCNYMNLTYTSLSLTTTCPSIWLGPHLHLSVRQLYLHLSFFFSLHLPLSAFTYWTSTAPSCPPVQLHHHLAFIMTCHWSSLLVITVTCLSQYVPPPVHLYQSVLHHHLNITFISPSIPSRPLWTPTCLPITLTFICLPLSTHLFPPFIH